MASRSDSPDDEGNTLGGNNVEDHALSGDHSQWRTESYNGKKIKSHYKLLIRDHADIVTEKTMKYSNLKNFNANGKKKIVLDLTNQRIKLRGDVLLFMVRYAGECARNWTYYPLSSKNWRAMDNGLKTRAWEKLVLTMFHIEPHQMKDASCWWDRKVAPAWSKARLALWRARKKHARENGFSADWVITETPRGVPSNDWLMFTTYVQNPEFEKSSVRNMGNIALKERNHHGGSRSLDRFTEEVIRETGQPPSRGQMFIKCLQRTYGTYKKETTKMITEAIIQLEAAGAPTFLGPNDFLALAPKNSEHSGRVRAFGLRFTPTMDFGGGDSLLDFLLLSSSSIVSVTSKPPAGLHPSRAEFEAMNRMVQECQELQARIKQIEQKFYASIGYVDTPLHPSQPHMYVQPHPAPLAPSSPARRDDATEDMYDQLHTTHPVHTSEPPIELTVSPLHPSQPHMNDQPHPAPSSPARRDDATEDMFHTAHPTHTSEPPIEPCVSREEFEATKRQLQECKEKLDEAYHRVARMVHNYQASVGLVATPLHSSQPHMYCPPHPTHPTPSSYVSKKDGTEDMVGEYMKQP
ncbi:hypothetical protein LINPERHAP1_LOCUS23902 [Linum perenne]